MAPALCGPTSSTPKRSTLAMVPPPALTVLMSIIGTAMSRPSILPRLEKIGRPSLISATSQDVPPMSKVMMLGNPVMAQAAAPPGDAGGRPGQHRGDGGACRGRKRRHAAVRLHDVFLPGGDAGAGQAAIEALDIACQDRLQVGVDDRRAQPVVLADLRQDFAGQRNIATRHFLTRNFTDARLVLGMKK